MRTARRRTGPVATTTCLATCLAVLVAGCTGGADTDPGEGDPAAQTEDAGPTDAPEESAAAARAADAYATALHRWSQRLTRAAQRPVPTRDRQDYPDYRSLRGLLQDAPRLREVEAPDGGTYDRAADVAARVDGVVGELRLLEGVDYDDAGPGTDLYYGPYTRYYDGLIGLDDASFSQRLDTVGSDLPGREVDRRLIAQYTRYARRLVTLDAEYAQRSDRVETSGPMQRSTVDFVLDEIDRLTGQHRRWLRELRAHPDDAAYQGLKDIAVQAPNGFAEAGSTPYRIRGELTRRMARDVAALARLAHPSDAALPDTAPRVGDAYRGVVVARASGSTKASQAASARLMQQLWSLWRLRQLEHTPRATYEQARQTLLLQAFKDTRSSWERLYAAVDQFEYTLTTREMRTNVRFLRDVLGQETVPPVLEPLWSQMREAQQRIEVGSGELFDVYAASHRTYVRLLRTMRDFSGRLDSDRRMTTAIADAMDATRQA